MGESDDDFNDSSTESETSSSEDETVSHVSINQGINPCKCCMCEDCDLRNHCIVIGFVEIGNKMKLKWSESNISFCLPTSQLFWLFFLLIMFFFGLITMDSDPVIYPQSTMNPRWMRATTPKPVGVARPLDVRNLEVDLHNIEKREVRGGILPPIEGGDGVGGGGYNFTDVESTTSFEAHLRARMGNAVFLVRPDTKEGHYNWRDNFGKFFYPTVLNFVIVIFFSIFSGFLCVNGAFYRKKLCLLFHCFFAIFTGILMGTLGGLLALLRGFTQAGFCWLCSALYIYFAFCSYGLVTAIRAGVYEDFTLDGVTYTYSTTLRAKVKSKKGDDGFDVTIHPNDKSVIF